MSEVTQADQDAAEQVLGEMVLGNESRAAQVIARHREEGAAAERAKIVAHIRHGDGYGEHSEVADMIEAKEHLK